jgi:DNA-binding beta-propeller fold protein YncE
MLTQSSGKPRTLHAENDHRSGLTAKLVAAALLVVAAFLLIPGGASAADYVSLGDFGSVTQPTFTGAASMAVDQSTGDLYVLNLEEPNSGAEHAGTLYRFKLNGEPDDFSALSSNVIENVGCITGFGVQEAQIAIDNSGTATEGRIYVTDLCNGVIDVFLPTGAFLEQLTESSDGPFAEPCGVAVDPSGHVWVGDFSQGVYKFGSPPVDGTTELHISPAEASCNVAAGAGASSGHVFVAGFADHVYQFNSTTGADEGEVVGGSPVNEGDRGLTVNPANGHVFFGGFFFLTGKGEIREVDASGASSVEVTNIPLASKPTGLAVSADTGRVYVAREGSSTVEVFALGFLLSVSRDGTGEGTVTATPADPTTPAGINCGTDCEAGFPEGEVVTLTATEENGSTFTGWSGAGCTGTGTCEVTMSEAKEVTATFTVTPKFILKVVKAGTGTGKVTSSPAGIDCGATCEHEFNEGTVVTLTATPTGGSTFAGWSGAGCNGTGTCEVTMSEAKEVTATFTAPSGGGGGGSTPSCATDPSLCPPSTATLPGTAKVKGGKAQIKISCPGPGKCSGVLKLSAKINGKKKAIGKKSFSLSGAASVMLKVKLSSAALKVLKKRKTLKAIASGTGVKSRTIKLKL